MAVQTKAKAAAKKKEPVKAKKKVTPAKAPVKKVSATKASVKVAASKKKAPVKKAVVAKTTTIKKPAVKKAPAATKKPVVQKKATAKQSVAKSAAKKNSPEKSKGLPEQLCHAAMNVLDERKAEDIVLVDLRGRSAIADYAIIATGGSARQLGALAEYLREAFFKLGMKKLRVEGLPQGDWVLVDAGDVLIHLFRPEVREYYHIEDIWSAQSPVSR